MSPPGAAALAWLVAVASAGAASASPAEVATAARAVALARGAWRLRMGEGQEPHGLFTLLRRRLDGAWRIVHDHTSAGE